MPCACWAPRFQASRAAGSGAGPQCMLGQPLPPDPSPPLHSPVGSLVLALAVASSYPPSPCPPAAGLVPLGLCSDPSSRKASLNPNARPGSLTNSTLGWPVTDLIGAGACH